MRFNIEMQFEVNLSSHSNFLDSLVIETKERFQTDATGKFVGRILEGIDQKLCDELVSGATSEVRCCEFPKLRRYRRESKNLSSSIGRISFVWNRPRCRDCGSDNVQRA